MEPEAQLEQVRREMLELSARLRRLEEILGVQAPYRAELPRAVVEPVATSPGLRPAGEPTDFGPEWRADQAAATPSPEELEEVLPYALDGASEPEKQRSLEGLVGGKYYLAGGAIVVVIGIGLFLKLGYDQGWFRMADAWKCIWGAVFGLAMVAGGELARRKINVWASTGLSAAGLGSIYLSTYAAHGFYSLIGASAAFVLLVLTSALGIGVSVLARLAAVAVLAMLGAYLAPFLLNIRHPSPLVLPLHTLALLGVGLTLSGWRHEVYRPLRTIAWWGTVVLGTFWLLTQGADNPFMALAYVAIFWGAVHAELIASVRARGAGEEEGGTPRFVAWKHSRHAVTSVSTSAWCVLAGIGVLRADPVLPDWFVPAGATVAAALLSMMLAGHLRVLRDSPRTDAQRLGAALAAQAGALLLTAVALAFTGSAEVLAWLLLGVAAAFAGRWIGAPALAFYAVFPLAIAAARLVTYDATVSRTVFVASEVAGLWLDRWSVLMWCAAAAWIVSGVLTLRLRTSFEPEDGDGRTERWFFLQVAPVASVCVGLALLMGSLFHPDASQGAIAVVYLVLSLLVSGAGRLEPRLHLSTIGLVVLVLGVGMWLTAYVLPGWTEVPARQYFHPGTGVGVAAIVAGQLLAVWHARGPEEERPHAPVCAGISVVMLWLVTSLEVFRLAANFRAGDEAQQGALSVWWGVFAVALLAAGFRWRIALARYAGLTLLGVATLKALIIDLADVSPGWRVVSVLGLGLLMLGVALVYVRASARLQQGETGAT